MSKVITFAEDKRRLRQVRLEVIEIFRLALLLFLYSG